MAPGPRRWIGDDWVWRERTAWPQLPEMPYQDRVVILDETATLQTHLDTFNSEVEFVLAQTGDDVLEAVRQCPAHVIIVNAPRVEQLQTLVDDLRGKVPATPIIGCVFPARPQQGLEEGILRYLIKPVVRADMEEALQALPSPVHRVLIVDDVPDVRHLFARMLHSVGEDIVIDTAATGVDALEAMKRGQPDLVLLDVILPDMDGWEVLKRKKYDAGIADIPTIMVSAEDPNRQPMRSDLLMTSIGSGFSITDLMNCSLALSEQLLHAPPASPAPVRR
jgi:CheY-like chemotaxis protein